MTLEDLHSIVNLADYYIALSAVAATIETMVVNILIDQCSPPTPEEFPTILAISVKIRAKNLYKDSFTHVVGYMSCIDDYWDQYVSKHLKSIKPMILDMIMSEYLRISAIKSRLDRNIIMALSVSANPSKPWLLDKINIEGFTSYLSSTLFDFGIILKNVHGERAFYASLKGPCINLQSCAYFDAYSYSLERDIESILRDNRRFRSLANPKCLTNADPGNKYPWKENEDEW